MNAYQAKALAKVQAIVNAHGKSWKNCWVPLVDGVTPQDHVEKTKTEIDRGRSCEFGNEYGIFCREILVSGDEAKRWGKLIPAGFGVCGLADENGDYTIVRYRMVNLGAVNRMRDPKCKPSAQKTPWRGMRI